MVSCNFLGKLRKKHSYPGKLAQNFAVNFENNTLGYPNYNIEDDRMLFSVVNNGFDILGYRGLTTDKLSGTGDAFILVEDAFWGVYYAIGDRDLTSTESVHLAKENLHIYPNPLSDELTIEFEANQTAELQIAVFDILGQQVHQLKHQVLDGQNQLALSLGHLTKGTYTLRLEYLGEVASQIITKF